MHTVVYVHGVVPLRGGDHTADYAAFRDGVSEALARMGGAPLPELEDSVTVEWGWAHPLAGSTAALAQAQEVIAARVAAVTPPDATSFGNLLFAPAIAPVRGLIQHTWADIVYLTSERGKARVRHAVWGAVLAQADPRRRLDLTVVGHSAGSLIAHDLLFWLFSGQRDGRDEALREFGLDPADVEAARANWRLRRLVTIGSPIAPLLVRSPAVADLVAAGGTLDAADLGLTRPSHDGRDPVWLNVWDRHDVLSWPVEPFYRGGRIEDLYPDGSDSLLASHEAYWTSAVVHRLLARRWHVSAT